MQSVEPVWHNCGRWGFWGTQCMGLGWGNEDGEEILQKGVILCLLGPPLPTSVPSFFYLSFESYQ